MHGKFYLVCRLPIRYLVQAVVFCPFTSGSVSVDEEVNFSASNLIKAYSYTASANQSLLCTRGNTVVARSVDGQIAKYDLNFCITMLTPNITQNADIMLAVLYRDSGIDDGVIKSSIFE